MFVVSFNSDASQSECLLVWLYKGGMTQVA